MSDSAPEPDTSAPRTKPAVLVVEDEEAIRSGLCDVLAFHGYEPHGSDRGDEGLRLALENPYSLVILDVMLPGMNGFEVCEKIREAHDRVPILMVTARGAEEDVLRGFRAGADDYVVKPFSIAQLMARAEAMMRRVQPEGDSEERDESGVFSFGPWEVDGAERIARQGDAKVDLTRRDVEIIELFKQDSGHIVSRRRLLKDVWGYSEPERVETRTVDMHIAKLRKKLSAADLIETVRGEGYRYNE